MTEHCDLEGCIRPNRTFGDKALPFYFKNPDHGGVQSPKAEVQP